MRPVEEMHAAVEEVDMDPCDLYTDLGTLIVEGRVPGLGDKGFGEGAHVNNRHQCDLNTPQCQKFDQILKHMLLLWKNGIPMTIEVLLYPDCCALPQQGIDSSLPDLPYILLEKWTIHMLPKRVPSSSISPRGLIQAVRSFLYFSQLCAWYSLTGGKSPQNVQYRVCVPGEAFSSKFSDQPDCHIFPVANIGRNAAMKVHLKCRPRVEGQMPPQVPLCRKHAAVAFKGRHIASSQHHASDGDESDDGETSLNTGEYVYDGLLAGGGSSGSVSGGDTLLGESLLDPPNSLAMYPKRYQSPSRCGSPSIEVPEHLMFGKTTAPEPPTPPRKSRPQRRPVVERFFKKNLGCPSANNQERVKMPGKDALLEKLGRENVLQGYCSFDDCVKNVSKEEMEQVLEQLRDRQKPRHNRLTSNDNGPMSRNHDGPTSDQDLSSYVQELSKKEVLRDRQKSRQSSFALEDDVTRSGKHIGPMSDLSSYVQDLTKDEMEQVLEQLRFRQKIRHCRDEGPMSRKHDGSTSARNLASDFQDLTKEEVLEQLRFRQRFQNCMDEGLMPRKHVGPTSDNRDDLSHYVQELSIDKRQRRLANKVKDNCDTSKKHFDEHARYLLPNKLKLQESPAYHLPSVGQSPSRLHQQPSSVNIKKYDGGAFLSDPYRPSEVTSDERELTTQQQQNNNNSQPSSEDLYDEDDVSSMRCSIPSAEKQAIFRRSLDSATRLVFQKSGLPLTSSPAPIRKCGTAFDYDSTLTSVSAIKRALFEKSCPDGPVQEEKEILSVSAPASIFSSSLLGTFEESVLNGRLEAVSTVEGFTAEIGASGSFCPRHIKLPVTVFFYTLQDMDKVTSPYMGHIDLRSKDYHVPKKGTVQVTLFNPHATVVKMFVVRYDLEDMPVNCQTFLRQRTLYMPKDTSEHAQSPKWLRYLIHLRFMSSKSGRIYLHTDIRLIIFRKSDLDAATVHGQRPYELRTFLHGPSNPKYSPHKPHS